MVSGMEEWEVEGRGAPRLLALMCPLRRPRLNDDVGSWCGCYVDQY